MLLCGVKPDAKRTAVSDAPGPHLVGFCQNQAVGVSTNNLDWLSFDEVFSGLLVFVKALLQLIVTLKLLLTFLIKVNPFWLRTFEQLNHFLSTAFVFEPPQPYLRVVLLFAE